MANEQLTIQPNDARMTVIGKSWPDQASDSGGGDWDDTYNGTYSGPIPRTDLPVKIAVTTPPTKTEYTKSEHIDFAGMVVTAYNDDGTVWTSAKYPDGTIPLNEIISTRNYPPSNEKTIRYTTDYHYVDADGNWKLLVYKVIVITGQAVLSFRRSYNSDTFLLSGEVGTSEFSGKITGIITPTDVENSAVILFGYEKDRGIIKPGSQYRNAYRINYILCTRERESTESILGSEQIIARCEKYKGANFQRDYEEWDKTAEQNYTDYTELKQEYRSGYTDYYYHGYVHDGKPVYWRKRQIGNANTAICKSSYGHSAGAGYWCEVVNSDLSRSPDDSDLTYGFNELPYTSFLELMWEVLYGDNYEVLNTVTIYWQRPEDGKYLSTSFDVTVKDDRLKIGGN